MCGVPALQSVVINKCLVAYPDSNPNPLLPAKLSSFLPVRIALFAGTAMALPFRLQSSHCPFSGVRIARFYLATMAFPWLFAYASRFILFSYIYTGRFAYSRRRFIQLNEQRAAFPQNLTKSEAAVPCALYVKLLVC